MKGQKWLGIYSLSCRGIGELPRAKALLDLAAANEPVVLSGRLPKSYLTSYLSMISQHRLVPQLLKV